MCPFLLDHVSYSLISIRVLRLVRIFRIFKLVRYNKAIKNYRLAMKLIKYELIMFFILMVFALYVASVGIYYFEHAVQPDKFASIFDCLWWSIVTLTTVGYGDIYPVTAGGKIFTFFILLTGIGVIAIPSGLFASALTKTIQSKKADEEENEGSEK
jgi:voltage-gated potassium channel